MNDVPDESGPKGMLMAHGVRVELADITKASALEEGGLGISKEEHIVFVIHLGEGGVLPVAFPREPFEKVILPAVTQVLGKPSLHRPGDNGVPLL